MNLITNKENIEKQTLAYLRDKYAQEFTIDEIMNKSDPQRGCYSLILCRDEKYDEPFYVYFTHILDDVSPESDATVVLGESGASYTVEDTYGDICASHIFSNEMQALFEPEAQIYYEVQLTSASLSNDQLAAGVSSVYKTIKDDASVCVYVIYDSRYAQRAEMIEKLKRVFSQYHFSLNSAYLCMAEQVEWKRIAQLKKETTGDFLEQLKADNAIEKIEFADITQEGELQTFLMIKG